MVIAQYTKISQVEIDLSLMDPCSEQLRHGRLAVMPPLYNQDETNTVTYLLNQTAVAYSKYLDRQTVENLETWQSWHRYIIKTKPILYRTY